MRILTGMGLWLCPLLLSAQVYVHPLAEQVGKDKIVYYLNVEGEVIPAEMEYSRKRIAERRNDRKPFVVTEHYANGQLALSTVMNEPDPVSTGFQDHFIRYSSNGDTLAYFSYRKNLRDGAYRLFHTNGNLKEKGTYDAGRKDGIRYRYQNKRVIF